MAGSTRRYQKAAELAVGVVKVRMALLAPVAITVAATPPGLLKLAATPLRLAAAITVAANCLVQISLGPLDALLAVIA
jgi:hypothetical protein